MTDATTQPAAQTTEAPAQPAVEATGAQPVQTADLDTILAEFDHGTKSAPAPEPKPAADVPPDVVKRLAEVETKLAEKDFKEAITPVLERIRGDIPKEVLGNDEIQDLIDGRARRDPRLQQAWINRAQNPGAWNKIEKALGQELSKKFSKLPDPEATEVREAVTAAVRGASTKAPAEKAPNYGAMTDAEFQREKASLGL